MEIKEKIVPEGYFKSRNIAYIATDTINGVLYEYSHIYENRYHSDELKSEFGMDAIRAFENTKRKLSKGNENISNRNEI